MRNSTLKIFAATGIVALFLQSCTMPTNVTSNDRDTKQDIDQTEEREQIVNANNQFAFDFFANLKEEDEGNIFFSPYSISTAVAMASEGARGETAREIEKVFHLPSDEKNRREAIMATYDRINTKEAKYQLSTANALWIQKDYEILDDYLQTVKKYYDGHATNVDFHEKPEEARQMINKWVEDKTNQKIKSLFPEGSLDSLTRLVLTNAVYFKGKWENPFPKELTIDQDFKVNATETVKTPMMALSGTEARFNYGEANDLQILEMEYEGKKLSMLILLPKDQDLGVLEKSLSLENLKTWKNSMSTKQVTVFIPKFTFDTKYSLNENLKAMGVPLAFQEPTATSGADFTGITKEKELYIGMVVHQAFVEVNEEGTEAAAATGMTLRQNIASSQPILFKADHPFIFLIQEKETGNILFMGRVMDPSKK